MLVIMVVVIILVLEVPEVVIMVVIHWTDCGDGESGVCSVKTCHIATCDTDEKEKIDKNDKKKA